MEREKEREREYGGGSFCLLLSFSFYPFLSFLLSSVCFASSPDFVLGGTVGVALGVEVATGADAACAPPKERVSDK